MANPSRKINNALKESLINEAGGKCANPGCSNTKTEFHHIKEWAIHKSHDQKHMIALCPSCREACHHGKLKIPEDRLYLWKKINHHHDAHGHVSVLPAENPRIVLGSMYFQSTTANESAIFNLSQKNKLSFHLKDDYLKINTVISDNNGNTIAKVTDNQVIGKTAMGVEISQIPGRFTIAVPRSKYYLPASHIVQMRRQVPDFAISESITAIDLEVIDAGLVKIRGFWNQGDNSVIATEERLSFCSPGLREPISIVGNKSTIMFNGSLINGLFSFNPES